ncbi:hypothetical protein CLOBOL_03731 [Enterocloster bolteae ATCC BAA-613]|uniref:Uncharacterized protein n=1 Tax=Enterocloster bolteae (strain ATCC BAA-613 / DSM 15670 / CCUG 46953 / JCM 12243 / WAL 16351) TaxID=411902 RepID=A8RTN2_ENTBW|nr:hypothetical protein CLOBOL_03731 [Enterocloster bolteae ATCC BAA-613]
MLSHAVRACCILENMRVTAKQSQCDRMYDISKMDKKWNAENCLYKTA